MAIFVYMLVISGSIAIASGHRCCLPGQVLTAEGRLTPKGLQCRDVQTSKKSPLSLTCPDRVVADYDDFGFFVNDEGMLEFPMPNRKVTYDDYCEEQLVRGSTVKRVALICKEPEPLIKDNVYGYCMAVSAVFLIVTAGRYGLIGLHRDLFGKSVINLCTSLAIGLFILAVMKLMPYSDMNWCAVRGFAAYYFVLVSFFWMNAIAQQTLNSIRSFSASSDELKAMERKWYPWCVAYAWGVPAMLTGLTALANYLPGDHLKPGIGLDHCWFFDKAQQWEYMYGVMAVLMVVNVVVFSLVTGALCCDAARPRGQHRQKFAICVKLFVVMGIPWIFEMVGSLTPEHLAWEIIDLFNALQGLWIFVVLVLLRTKTNNESDENTRYMNNITCAEPPYLKLDK